MFPHLQRLDFLVETALRGIPWASGLMPLPETTHTSELTFLPSSYVVDSDSCLLHWTLSSAEEVTASLVPSLGQEQSPAGGLDK